MGNVFEMGGSIKRSAIFAIVAGFLLIAMFFMLLPSCVPSVYQDLIDHGVETEATILGGTQDSDMEIQGVKYYNIKYTFKDEKGVEHEGKTTTKYTIEKIKAMEENKTIKILYDRETFESIEADVKEDEGAGSVRFIPIIIMGVIDIILWIIAIYGFRNALAEIRMKRKDLYNGGI